MIVRFAVGIESPAALNLAVGVGEPKFHKLEPHTRMARAARATAKGGLSGLMFVPRPARVNVSAAVSQLPVLTRRLIPACVSTEAIGTIIKEMAPRGPSKATRSPRRAGRAP